MITEVTATSVPQRIIGLPEFFAIVRRLRSMVSEMSRRLFSAEKLFSIVLWFLKVSTPVAHRVIFKSDAKVK